MNLQESIRRILREEDFIPLEDLNTVIKDYEDGFDVFIMNKDKKIGEISFAKEDKPNQYTIVDATIDDEYKGNRIYSKTIINLFKERPNIIINSVFRSPEAEKAWKYLLSDLPSNIEYKVKYYEDEETTLYQLKLKNLQESIRRILKEETGSVKNLNESKTSQHLKLMNNLLDPFKEKDCLCDIKISFDVEENYYDIYLVFSQKELHEKFFNLYGIRSYIQKMMNEVKMELESFLPIRNIFIGNYTKPNCEWSPLNESEDDKEKKIQKNLTVLRKLISMFDYSEVCDMWVEYDYEDGDYIIRSKMSTKNHNTAALEKEFEFLEDSIESFGFTNCYVFRPYYVENCENELNESEDNEEKKIQKNLKAIRHLLETIDIDGLCKIWVEYNPEDGDYEIRSTTTNRYYDLADMTEELDYIDDTIRSWKLKPYIFTPNYVENCEDEIEFMNESDESRQERKFTKLLNNIEEYINSNSYNSVVRVMVDYDEVMDDVIVNIFFDAEHAVKLGGGINSVIKRTGKKIMEDLSVFPFDFKYHIHFEKPQLNESIKKVLKEETEGIDSFLDEISSKHNMSDELRDFVKQFIEESDCKRINFSRFKMGVMGLALESGVLINSVALNHPLPFLLFLIFHEVAHQYQFKKYGEDVMYDCYLGEISEREAAEFMKHTEEVADDFASRKIRQLQKLNLIGPYTPPQMYKNVPIQQITMMINNYREDMRRKNIDSPKKVSEYFYNMVKSEL